MIFDPFELNYTKIKFYLNCPLIYKYIYIDKKFIPPTPFSSFGISLHRTLEQYSRRGRDLNDLFLYYDENWCNQGYLSSQQSLEFYNKGRKILENYWLQEQDRKTAIVYVEQNFEFPFEKWTVKGTIDRVDRNVDGSYDLIDYKTSLDEKNGMDIRDNLQLGIYAIGMKKAFNINIKTITHWILVKSEKISMPYNSLNQEKIFLILREVGEKILSSDFSKRGNCLICPIKKFCSESNF
jgi:RecB family exonuclease